MKRAMYVHANKNGLAGKLHLELKQPTIGVSIEHKPSGKRVVIVLGTDPFDVPAGRYNGGAVEVTNEWIDGAIDQLQRAKELYAKELVHDAKMGTAAPAWDFPNALQAIQVRKT